MGAARADGKPYDWAGTLGKFNYTLPRVDALKAQSNLCQKTDYKYQQSLPKVRTAKESSITTALAAGTAVKVLKSVIIAAIEASDSSRGVTRLVLPGDVEARQHDSSRAQIR
ncbi:putative Peptidase S8/S53 domain-containing protein [Seiridium cardinale]